MAVYNWVEFASGGIRFMQNCSTCMYDGCKGVEALTFGKDDKSGDEFAEKLFDSCWALRGLVKQLSLKNIARTAELFSSYYFTDPDDGKIKLHIMSSLPNADIISVSQCSGYLQIRFLDPHGFCKKDCDGRRRTGKYQPKFNPNCVKFAVWDKFMQKMRS